MINKTLKLFNAVLEDKTKTGDLFISTDHGIVIEPDAAHLKNEILAYYNQERLDGAELNKTFHKSWLKIKESSRFELYLEQITHYLSTYGSGFKDEIYLPDELLDIDGLRLKFIVIKAYSKTELVNKSLDLLRSGIALKEETVNDILALLISLDYKFTGNEGVKNKEAVIKIADLYNVLPQDTMEFFRYIIYRSTGQSLLIKNKEVIEAIKTSNYNPGVQFEQFGFETLAEIFNRFKPLFLAFKKKCPHAINRIARLSKTHHKPLIPNPLNNATSEILTSENVHWLDNATPFALFKALSACWSRMQGQDTFAYRVRNGKYFVKNGGNASQNVINRNYNFIIDYLQKRIDLKGKSFLFSEGVEYALPTSEKMFVGNIPVGTKFYGDKLAVGIFWENDWGARDLDLSGINIAGKIGWNADYNANSLMYSGDITNAPNGAVEYLYAKNSKIHPTLVKNNVYTGDANAGYKIILGQGDNIDKNYMMNPEKLFFEVKTESVTKQTIIGLLLPGLLSTDKMSFVLLNTGLGAMRVSGNGDLSNLALKALYQQWNNPLSFRNLISSLGGTVVYDVGVADYDLRIESIEKDSFVNLLNK